MPTKAPPMVVSSPSSSQVMPNAVTMVQCQRVQGNRSRRAGTLLSMIAEAIASCTSALSLLGRARLDLMRQKTVRFVEGDSLSDAQRRYAEVLKEVNHVPSSASC